MGKIENLNGGWGEIRTHGGRKPSTVFKTVAFNRSATYPLKTKYIIYRYFKKANVFLNFFLYFK